MKVPPSALPPPSQSIRRYQAWLIVSIVSIIALVVIVQAAANFYTDYLWFRSESVDDVWRAMTWAKIELTGFFAGIFFVACWASLFIVDRLAPRMVFLAPEQEVVKRYQAAVGRHRFAVRTVVSFFLAAAVGGGVGSQWQHWLLFRKGGSFGIRDPQFHKDIGYFVFKLPFLSFVVDWTQVALFVLFLVCMAAYYLNGGLRFSGSAPRIDPRATAHFSVILAAFALLRAAGYFYVDRYALDLSSDGLFQGAGYTAVHVRLPALNLLAIIALLAFVMFVYNVYSRGWVIPAVAAGLWALIGIGVGVIYPWIVQDVQVSPSASQYELPYIARNITATQDAYQLQGLLDPKPFAGNSDATAGVLKAESPTFEDLNLWDPSVSASAYQQVQKIKGYYTINGLSVDRYTLNTGEKGASETTPVVVGVREINSNLNRLTWVTQHLVYTHGEGVVMATDNGTSHTPTYEISGLPVTTTKGSGAPSLSKPDVYYGVGESGYVVVDTRYQSTSGPTTSTYKGLGGIRIGSFLEKAALALHFHDYNLFVSRLIKPTSRIMFNQDVRSLLQKAAPFLRVDANPYPVINTATGEIDWVVDCYTTSSYYPYAEPANTPGLTDGSPLGSGFNYVRDSVKAVVNAYTGQVTLYAVDESDPILRAWESEFPGLFKPFSSFPAPLQNHIRYPQDMLSMMATVYGKYHLPASDAGQFYTQAQAWQVATTGGSPSGGASSTQPVYEMLQTNLASSPSFEAVVALSPVRAQNLTAYLTASCNYAGYPQLTAYTVPNDNVKGPGLADAAMAVDPALSRATTLKDQHGSTVSFGPTLLVPIDDSLLWARAFFVESSTAPIVPELQGVVVVYGSKVGFASNLLGKAGALAQVVGPSVAANVGPAGPVNIPAEIATEITEANSLQAAALTALSRRDFATYGKDQAEVHVLLARAEAQLAKLHESSTSPSSTSPSTTTSVPNTTIVKKGSV